MSKLLTALIAAGFGVGLSAAVAQDVKSDREKTKGQEEIMQQKERGVDQHAQGQRDRSATDDGRSTPSAPGVGHPQEGQTTGQGQGAKKDNQQSDRTDSNSSTGMSNQDNTSGQTSSDQTTGKKKRMQQ